ncbi:MAG: HI0074 family nucleotidyltransferase substrate-binding subunit [Legionellaceae bacterium]
MSIEPFKLKQQAFNRALQKLDEALREPASEYIRDAAIQRFEFTYELAWKTLKAYLSSQDIVVLSPKETLQVAYQQGLLQDANAWSELHMKRNLTSHTYDEVLAEEIYNYLKAEGLSLFITLKNTLEQLK